MAAMRLPRRKADLPACMVRADLREGPARHEAQDGFFPDGKFTFIIFFSNMAFIFKPVYCVILHWSPSKNLLEASGGLKCPISTFPYTRIENELRSRPALSTKARACADKPLCDIFHKVIPQGFNTFFGTSYFEVNPVLE